MEGGDTATPFIIAVTGIIGAGKSTIIERLRTSPLLAEMLKPCYGGWAPKIVCVREKSKEWEENGDLARFYNEPKKYAYWFQTLVLNAFVESIDDALAKNPDIIIVERTMYCQRIFWELQVTQGHCQEHEDRAYRGGDLSGTAGIWSKWRRLAPKPDVILYAKTEELRTTLRRVKDWGRDAEKVDVHSNNESEGKEETGVTVEYQQLLATAHDKAYTQYRCTPFESTSIDCIHICTDSAFHTNDNVLKTTIIDPIYRVIARKRGGQENVGIEVTFLRSKEIKPPQSSSYGSTDETWPSPFSSDGFTFV